MLGESYDVVVVGGGSAGVAAAVGAAECGARTLLVEEAGCLGGAATNSSVLTYCGFFTQAEHPEQVVAGVGERVLAELRQLGVARQPVRTPRTGTVIYLLDPEAVKLALDRVVTQAGVDVLLHTRFLHAIREGQEVKRILCQDRRGVFSIGGKVFVDASGDAVVVHAAEGRVRTGDGQGGFQAATTVMRIGGVDPGADCHPTRLAEAVKKAKSQGIVPLRKELGTVVRLPLSGDVLALLVEVETDGLSAESLTRAELEGRRQAWAYLEAFRRFVPGFERAYLVMTGPALGVRETRHIEGEYVLTGEDVIRGARFPTAVARGGWPVELHLVPGAPNEWRSIAGNGYYEIPFESLRVRNLSNVIAAGRIISCDSVAYGSVRVMGTAFATGHAAGVAAALYAQSGRWSADETRRELLRQGAIV